MKMNLAFRVPALLALVPVHLYAADAEPDTDHPAVVQVVGRMSSGAYYHHEASGAKADLPLRELPQAVRIMTRQSLDDLGAVRVDDALDFVGGISRQNGFGGLWDNFAVRGLAGDQNNGIALLQNGFADRKST
jgi:iron complex outermembrane receptor protein